MSLPIWIPDALHSEQLSVDQTYWRCVEAQHVVSTLQLVDTIVPTIASRQPSFTVSTWAPSKLHTT